MKKCKWLKVLSAFALSLAIASSACACSFSDVFSGGNDETPSVSGEETDAQIRSIYDLYVESCEKSGDAPLTYEKWLASIKGEKGDEGDKGDKGDKGNGWLYGEGAPQNALGDNGDLYLDYKNWDVYTKDNGSWTKRGNIKGEKGDKGDPGTSGGTTEPDHGDEYQGQLSSEAPLTFRFLELGNKYTGDCTLVKVGETEVLIDAGSRQGSAETIVPEIKKHVDGKLDYVIATHAHQDHIAAFVGTTGAAGVFDSFECGTIIDFAKTNQSETTSSGNRSLYGKYLDERAEEIAAGAKHYTALECCNQTNGAEKSYDLGHGVTMEILYQRYYSDNSSDENNYSVCVLFSEGDSHFLFTGDLEKEGEESLAAENDLPHCRLFKGGHHGSKTSSNEVLLKEITPDNVCICCCAGSTEYGATAGVKDYNNTFPTQDMINRVAKYTKNIYVTTLATGIDPVGWSWDGFTSMNGDITVTWTGTVITVVGSKNSTVLKDTEWFQQYRTWPTDGVQ